jgi:hypothetical protein
MITVLRPLSTSELLDRTFHLYRNHFLTFVGISAIPQLFILPVTLGGAAMAMRQSYVWSSLMTMTGYFLFYLAWFISQAPTVVAVSNLQTQKPIGIGSAYSGARRSLLRVIWIVFLIFVIWGVAFGVGGTLIALAIGAIAAVSSTAIVVITALVLTIPPLYFALRWMLGWALAIPATVLESGWFLTSIRRSLYLSKGNRWRIFVVCVLIGIFAAIVAFIVRLVVMIPSPFYGARDFRRAQAEFEALKALGVFISTSLVGPLGTIALTLIYYDERVRKEGFDLQLMMANLEGGTPRTAATVPAS